MERRACPTVERRPDAERIVGVVLFPLSLKNGRANSGLHVCVILNKVNDVLHRCAGVTFNLDQEAYSHDFNGH